MRYAIAHVKAKFH